MTVQCPGCGSSKVNWLYADPDMNGNDTLDCHDCGNNYVFKQGSWEK